MASLLDRFTIHNPNSMYDKTRPIQLYHKTNPTPVKVARGLFKSKSNISTNQTKARKVARVFTSPVFKVNE